MGKRAVVLGGMVAGLIWASLVIWSGPMWKDLPLDVAVMFGLGLAGLPLLLMIARLAQRRFLDDSFIDGQPLSGPAEIDQRVLTNTVEQLVLAICVWPVAGFVLGSGTVLALGGSFVVMRLVFWLGYHLSPPLRSFGFAASFYPTVLAALWVLGEGWQMLRG